eukprot:gene8153-14080_t
MIESETWNVILAYAPQTGMDVAEKVRFQKQLEDLVSESPNENIIIGADMTRTRWYEAGSSREIHGGKGFGNRNEDGDRSLESLNLVLVNTFFTKRREHLIEYKSGGKKPKRLHHVEKNRL